jgi:hypothetical protein
MKKILYLEHPQADLNAYNIYKGLCELLGEENVIDFPRKRVYRAEYDVFDSPYLSMLRLEHTSNKSLPYGIPPFAPGEDIISGWPDVRIPVEEAPWTWGHFVPKRFKYQGGYPLIGLSTKDRDHSEDDIIRMLKNNEIAFIVLSTSHRVCTIALARLRDRLGGLNKLPPIIYTDNGERDELNEHWAHVFNPTIIFKCTLTESTKDSLFKKYGWRHVYPLPNSNFMLGQNFSEHFNTEPSFYDSIKKYDVFYQFLSHVDRENVMSAMERVCLKNNYTSYLKTGDYFQYLQTLSQSKIVVTKSGVCKETLRYWDINMFETMMLCDNTMGAIHPNPFEHEKSAVFYNSDSSSLENDLNDRCKFYLEHDSERIKIAQAGMEHLRKYHTNRARAEWMLSVIKSFRIEIPE